MKSAFIVGGFLLLAGLSFFAYSTTACIFCANNTSTYESVDVIKFNELTKKDVIIIDIRTQEEYVSGHIENSINIDYYSPSFRSNLNSLDKNKTYLIYCRSGSRSSSALNIMEELDFVEVFELSGGINSWNNSKLPLVR